MKSSGLPGVGKGVIPGIRIKMNLGSLNRDGDRGAAGIRGSFFDDTEGFVDRYKSRPFKGIRIDDVSGRLKVIWKS
ncbi:MAG: hypothetical protein ACJAVK_001143 [Akkermansiaceae bacterium]|jgi:hypothetical protein